MPSTRILVVDSGFRGPKGDKGDPGAPGGGAAGQGVPTGGTANQVLKKNSGTDYDTHWVAETVPTGGTTGQVLKKNSNSDWDLVWGTGSGSSVPVGGTTGQVLAKNSGTDGDAGWVSPTAPATATPLANGTAAVGTATKYAREDHVHVMPRLDQVGAPTADVSVNTHKLTNVVDPTGDQDAATKGYVDDSVVLKVDATASAVAALIPGLTVTVVYDNTLGWVLPTGLSTLANLAWIFNGGDVSHAPPSVTSTRREWNRPA